MNYFLEQLASMTGAGVSAACCLGVPLVLSAAGAFFALYKTVGTIVPSAQAGDIACYGTNSCKGQSDCTTAFNACNGQNECKGKGISFLTQKQCYAQGVCH